MKITTHESKAEYARWLATKTQDQYMINEVLSGTRMSPREAEIVIKLIRKIYFRNPGKAPLRHGQMLLTCVKIEAGAGVALKEFPMIGVTLSLLGKGDDQKTSVAIVSDASVKRPRARRATDPGGPRPNPQL